MGIGSFFGKIASFFTRAVHLIKEYVPEEVLNAAVEKVREAATKYVDNTERREAVVTYLMEHFHISESIARLATELAVNIIKKELD